jgi:CheY-like chemotaxis protein
MSRTVLVIDDDRLALHTVETLLRRQGFRVRRAANGAEGLACLRPEPADVVPADIIMPERGDIETIREMRCPRPEARTVVVPRAGTIGRDRLLGADCALAKHFDREEPSAATRQAMADAR